MDTLVSELGLRPSASHPPLQFLCNMCFSDVLPAHKNHKFPGTQVVSLSRRHLPLLRGAPATHMLYRPAELLSWWEPTPHIIPPLQIHALPQPVARVTVKDTTLDVMRLDFGLGGEEGFCVPSAIVPATALDFGGMDGFFQVPQT